MKLNSLLPILTTILLLLSACQNQEKTASFDSSEQPEEEAHKEIPSDWFYAQRAYPNNKIDKQAYIEAVKTKKKMGTGNSQRDFGAWNFAGPVNIGGRVTDIEMHASSTEIMYIGAAAGGIFKSTDGGENFEPIFDDALSLSIGDIAIAPSNENIIYVGTGEPNAGGGSLAYDGVGVYRSGDAGETWEHVGLEDAGSIGKVLVHPTDPQVAYVGSMGNLFANNGQRGVFKTTDSGQSWQQVLMVSDSTGVIDMTINPNEPNTIYAAAWERVRRPGYRNYGGPTSGIYRSSDGGDNWEELTNGLPSIANLKGRIGIDISASDPNILVAVYANADGPISGAFKSTDGGDNWVPMNYSGVDDVPYMWWFGDVIIHPTNPEEIFYMSLNMFKTSNGGANWNTFFNGQHVDQHDVFIHPENPSLVLTANDGGLYISNNSGGTYNKVNTLPITQFYACEIDASNPERLYAGSQDNGTNRTLTGNDNDWSQILGGDGFTPLVNPDNNNFVYGSIQNGLLFRSINGGGSGSFSNISPNTGFNERKNWNTPTVFDPSNSEIMYYGSNRLYKSENGGSSWNVISDDLTNDIPQGNLAFGTITTISVSPIDGNIIWVGTDDGNISLTTDGGSNWSNVSTSANRWITRVAADPNSPETAYVTYSGYRFGESIGQIYMTIDNGANWIDLSNNLPDIPINDVIIHPEFEEVYIATDVGVFVLGDGLLDWEVMGSDFPNVVVTDLDLHEETNKLVAATYGRSMFSIELEDLVSNKELIADDFSIALSPNPLTNIGRIQLVTQKKSTVDLGIFDGFGQEIKPVFKGELSNGTHDFSFQTTGLPPGVLYCRIQNDKGIVKTLKFIKTN